MQKMQIEPPSASKHRRFCVPPCERQRKFKQECSDLRAARYCTRVARPILTFTHHLDLPNPALLHNQHTEIPASHTQQAIYEYITDPSVSIKSAAVSHEHNPNMFHRIVVRWHSANLSTVPTSPSEIIFPLSAPGRPRAFSPDGEEILANTIIRCAEDG